MRWEEKAFCRRRRSSQREGAESGETRNTTDLDLEEEFDLLTDEEIEISHF